MKCIHSKNISFEANLISLKKLAPQINLKKGTDFICL